jgi:hypothetical protein
MDRYAADAAGDGDEGAGGEDTTRTNSNSHTNTEHERFAALPPSLNRRGQPASRPLRLPFPSLFIRSRAAFCCAIHTVPSLLLSSD